MGEGLLVRKGGVGSEKILAPTITITDIGGSFIRFNITNNESNDELTMFLLANYDTNSTTDFDVIATQNGEVVTVPASSTVSVIISELNSNTTHVISAQASLLKTDPLKLILFSDIVSTNPITLTNDSVSAPTIQSIVSDTFVNSNTTLQISVTNSAPILSLVIKANFTESTTPPEVYPFETEIVAAGATTTLTLTGLTINTEYYIHARAFDGQFASSNVVFGPYTTDGPLYEFTTWTFTNAGIGGHTGPNITQVRSAYSSQSWAQDNDYLSMTTQGIQAWKVPMTGAYQIEIYGARGGGGTQVAGLGAKMQGDFNLTKGEVIHILVGQQGTGSTSGCASGGGGGGTFVVKSPYNTLGSAMIVAGGGGGGANESGFSTGIGGTTSTSGTAGNGGAAAGGTNGGAGQIGSYLGGACGSNYRAGGGAGFLGNSVYWNGSNAGADSFINGGNGKSSGGFGSGGPNSYGGGGGGGYSGGGAGTASCNCSLFRAGGGGGSVNNGTNQVNESAVRSGHGLVIITKL